MNSATKIELRDYGRVFCWVKNGHIRRVIDDEVKSLVLEVAGTNVATTYITCPIRPRASLAIRLPFLVMIVKNMKKYFTFEIQILDDKDMHRRFRVSNFQSTTKVRPFCTTMPIGLSSGWNQIQFNLADFTRRAYGTMYLETMRVQVHANVRIRRIYFADRLYSEDEMPSEYRLFIPLSTQKESKIQEQERRSSKEETALKMETKLIKSETVAPAAAPPSPVGTEAILKEALPTEALEEETAFALELTEGDESEAIPSEEPPSEMAPSEEQPSEIAPSEGQEAQTSEAPPSEGAPSEEPPAEEPLTEEEGAKPDDASEAPATETTEAPPAEGQADTPAETPVETPAEVLDEAPAEAPAEETAEAPEELNE